MILQTAMEIGRTDRRVSAESVGWDVSGGTGGAHFRCSPGGTPLRSQGRCCGEEGAQAPQVHHQRNCEGLELGLRLPAVARLPQSAAHQVGEPSLGGGALLQECLDSRGALRRSGALQDGLPPR